MPLSLRGVHVPHRKHTADTLPETMPSPSTIILPTAMHIGKPATPCVKPGDHVDIGTLVAEQTGPLSSPIHSGVSGTGKKIEDILLSNGNTAPAIVIESDDAQTVSPTVVPPVVTDRDSLLTAIENSGVVGLGGAGFPTHVKFRVDDPTAIDYLILNGAECEPYITSDSVTMIEQREDMAVALTAIHDLFGIPQTIIGIEENKPKAIRSMKQLAAEDARITVKVLPSRYPQGGEKVLIYHTTGRVVPMGKLPKDVGCIVCNVSTIAVIGRYLRTGMPLTTRCITVDGGAVNNPKNVIVPIGTPLREVFDFCGGFKQPPSKVLYGGPMMGVSVPSTDLPVLKNTNAILALTDKENDLPKTTHCIRCGACTNHCPFGINPAEIAIAHSRGDVERLEKLGATLCMECGCCSFICPANRPLVQSNKLAKAMLKKAKEGDAR